MIRSASGTYSLPSACMKSYWVSTSQKMTRAMAGNLSEDTGACQQRGGRTKSLPVLEFEDYGDLITTVVARAPHTVRPHLEREVLALGGHEARLQKEGRLAGQREAFGQSVRARLGDQGREQRAADARPLPIRPDGEGGELRELSRVNLERSATDDLARRGLRDDVFLDVAAEVVVAARQQVAGLNVRSHEGFELRHVRQHRFPQRHTIESRTPCSLLPEDGYGTHARISSRIASPRSSSGTVITSGGRRRITCGPAVTTNSPRSRAAATIGAASSASSSPHMSPRPRTSRTRGAPAASRARCAPSHSALRRTSARNAGSAIVRTTSRATPATSGPPPNVVAWSPGLSAAATALVTRTAPMGSPPASGFARVRMSGTTPACSYANSVPVRPRPHCTSSKMTATPRESHNSRRNPSHSGSIGRTPPSPCTGSTITAAVRDADTAWSTAAQSSRGTMRMPGTSGSNGFRYSRRSVAASVANRRPWKLPLKATISLFPDHLRANLNAASFASAPELQKKTRSANDRATSSSASRSAGAVRYRFET